MQVRARRRTFRLPTGESPLTRWTRAKWLLSELKDGRSPSRKAIVKCLEEYAGLLEKLYWWGLKRK